jgi:hypothetical protein
VTPQHPSRLALRATLTGLLLRSGLHWVTPQPVTSDGLRPSSASVCSAAADAFLLTDADYGDTITLETRKNLPGLHCFMGV